MLSMTRALKYVTRKKSKSFLMFLILFGIATAIISGMAIKKGTTETKTQINQSINAGFSIEKNLEFNRGVGSRGYGNIPASIVKEVEAVKGITRANPRLIREVDMNNLEKVKVSDSQLQMDPGLREMYKHTLNLESTRDSSLSKVFTGGVVALKEGRHIEAEDRQKILVHEDFAALNNLSLHDTIELQKSEFFEPTAEDPSAPVQKVPLEIVGIFSGENTSQATMDEELIENKLISDIQTMQKIYGYNDETIIYEDVNFFADNPDDLPNIMKEVEKLPIDQQNFTIMTSASDFPTLTRSLDNMDGLIQKMLIGVIIVSAVILSLVLAFWVNGRIHETGVLLSLGISKRSIITQYVLELFMIAIVAFGLSYFSGNMIAQNIGNNMVEQANKESVTHLQQELGGMTLGADPETGLVKKSLDGIDVSISLSEMGYVWLIGGLIILLSVAISSIMIIRLKPKEILSKMS